jgi:hypothetical protein
MDKWFAVSKDGLRGLVADRPKSFIVRELVQNAWDELGVTKVEVRISPIEGSRYRLTVEDDAPEGFHDITHAFTLYADTRKRKDPSLRGRFNLGEKEVLALCDEARIVTMSAGVVFKADGSRSRTNDRRESGSSFSAAIRMSKAEYEEACVKVMTFIPPKGIATVFNGKEVEQRTPRRTICTKLETEFSMEGIMRSTKRETTVDILQPLEGEVPTLYELGLPIMETGDRWHYNVNQRVPMTTSRDNVKESYLRDLRAEVLNAMAEELSEEEMAEEWVRDAMEDERVEARTVEKVVRGQHGEHAFIADPKDPQANERAQAKGWTIVSPRAYSKSAWENIRKADGVLPRSTDIPGVGRTHVVESEKIPERCLTDGMRRVASLARFVAKETMGIEIVTTFSEAPWASTAACYGGRTLSFNVSELGNRWFDPVCSQEQLDLLIHEIGHEHGHHLEMGYHEALTKIGAKLALMDPNELRKAAKA